MSLQKEQAVLIIGAGQGGAPLLEILSREAGIRIVGIVDINPDARAIKKARELAIEVYTDIGTALEKSGECLIFNMTHDQSMVELATRSIDAENVIGGQQAEFFWHMIVRLQAVIHNIQESIISISPQGIIEGANPATVNIFGYAVDQLIGQNIKMLMPEPDQSQHESYLQEYQRTGKRHVIGQYRELVALDKDGRQFPLEMNIAEMKLGGEKHFIGLLRGITERKIAEEKLTELALFDQLTALPNRKNFLGRVEYSLFSAKRIKAVVALFFIDLNGFKKINDSLGHATGDHVLKAVVCVPVSGSRIPLPAWAAMNLRSYSIT